MDKETKPTHIVIIPDGNISFPYPVSGFDTGSGN
jgi:hypothetical protein